MAITATPDLFISYADVNLEDSSPNANHLAVNNGIAIVSDIRTTCGELDGIGDYGARAHASCVNLDAGTGSFYHSVWVKGITDLGGSAFIAGKRGGGGGNDQGYQFEGAGVSGPGTRIRAYIADGGGNSAQVSVEAQAITDGAIHLLTMRCDRDAQLLHFLIDGVSKGSASTAAVGSISNTDRFCVGRFDALSSGYLAGRVDQNVFIKGYKGSDADAVWEWNSGSGRDYADYNAAPAATFLPCVLLFRRRNRR